ncbi:hypothetical protein ACTWQL_24660 [Pseudalkalibacillus sp. R45]|uniref:hypothetical protein n=1 Tax=Pseudalkalibacillus sp. R45 TaxID=3457433 RepID=UPI003FCD203F
MSSYTAKEAATFFQSYCVSCDEGEVQEWMNKDRRTNTDNPVCEDDLYQFNEWCRWRGTAYEEGIDEPTKTERLLEEISELKRERSLLRKEIEALKEQLGIMPF